MCTVYIEIQKKNRCYQSCSLLCMRYLRCLSCYWNCASAAGDSFYSFWLGMHRQRDVHLCIVMGGEPRGEHLFIKIHQKICLAVNLLQISVIKFTQSGQGNNPEMNIYTIFLSFLRQCVLSKNLDPQFFVKATFGQKRWKLNFKNCNFIVYNLYYPQTRNSYSVM